MSLVIDTALVFSLKEIEHGTHPYFHLALLFLILCHPSIPLC